MMGKSQQIEILAKAREWVEIGGAEFLFDLVRLYTDESSRIMTQLRHDFESGNESDFKRAAHSLKSSSANMGAVGFAALAEKIEIATRQGRMSQLAAEVAQLESEYPEVERALEAARAEHAGE